MHRRQSLALALCPVVLSTACLGRPDAEMDLSEATYAGSDSCQTCHAEIHDRWQDTLMAKVIQDPREHPEVILGDFAANDPLVTFTPEDVVFTYGSKWKQRYYTQVGDDYFVFPAQWDVQNRQWRRYNPQPGREWWADHYPADQMQRPTGPLCDGCHSVNYDITTKTPTEWNVGCEACHGPGSLHNTAQTAATIINPARLDPVRADDICIQCHSQGRPLENPINGSTTTGRWGIVPAIDSATIGNLKAPSWGRKRSRTGRTAQPTRIGCRATTSSRARCP